ncbi:MAG: ORF6N domain-containing protein [Rhodoferax sp.]
MPTKRFKEAVKRNLTRFPSDLMFTLTDEEFAASRSQYATAKDQAPVRSSRRYVTRAFAEHGAGMAATLLSSPRRHGRVAPAVTAAASRPSSSRHTAPAADPSPRPAPAARSSAAPSPRSRRSGPARRTGSGPRP